MTSYKSDKKAFEESFLLFQLGVVALNAISKDISEFAAPVKQVFLAATEGKNQVKIIKRCARVSKDLMPLIQNKQEAKVEGHKFILILYSLTQKILDSGYILPPQVIEAFVPFLELEAAQDKRPSGEIITNEDWLKIKASADKISGKLFSKLRSDGYFLPKIN
ncbi:hypothetical protein UFOVP1451_24 [uncultured Caudovirales phage]|uniref:Uncharacterized protein n=1 Tax=uncultured Caudovirales phage TaxID=2100421 RepID=A0A6J5SHK2_9CAUD|nr:hypothetical protein UFOVP1451_24 [uncultured Caudovirales phage]